MKRKKQKTYGKVDLATLRDFIVILDGYRVRDYTDTEFMDKAVVEGKLGSKFMENWKEIRKILIKMASSSASIPDVVKFIKIRDAIGFVSMILMTAAFVLVILQIALKQSILGFYGEFIYLSAFILLIVTIISRFLINRKIGLKIEKYHTENPEKFRNHLLRLREVVQDLLYSLSKHIKLSGGDPDDYKMRLYDVDYKRIKIIQEPDRWRRYYVVVPQT